MQKELGWYLASVPRKKYKSKRHLKKNPPEGYTPDEADDQLWTSSQFYGDKA